jgi:outer membrane protein assembly factor BamB
MIHASFLIYSRKIRFGALFGFAVLSFLTAGLVVAAGDGNFEDLAGRAGAAWAGGKHEDALALATQAIETEPKNPRGYSLRARFYSQNREPVKALADYDQVLKLGPSLADAWQQRGLEHFKLGHIGESIADFDQFIALAPAQAPYHWQRGIACYYAGRFEDGRKQFELHQTVNPNDVENAVWHFLCVARSAGVEKARASLIPINGDARVPMMEVHALFAGRAKPEDVLKAARAAGPPSPRQDRALFYAYLYLALYCEATGDDAHAHDHIMKAAGQYRTDDYMGDVARVHLQLRESKESPATAKNQDCWPQFRGPVGDGSAPGADPPLVWSESTNVAWKVRVTGRGRSSPIILGDRIWLTTAVEQGVVRTNIGPDDLQAADHVSLRAVCLDRRTGKSLWEKALFEVAHPDPVHWLNSWATPTPVVETGRVYCDFGTFGTACLDAETGNVVWQQRLPLDHAVGPGSSPILWHDRLLLVRDGRDAQYVAALDTKTGATAWKTERPPLGAANGDHRKSFATPLLIGQGAQTQVLVPGPHWAVAYEPDTGKEIWRVRHGDGWSIGTCPVFAQGIAYFSTGFDRPEVWAVRVDGRDDVTATHVVWKSLRQAPLVPSPILAAGSIYWVSDSGMLTCADAKTGDVQWQERLGGRCLASPVLAHERLYFFRQDGKAIVIKAGGPFERLAENAIEGNVAATPAVGGRTIYLRTDSHLYCIGE